MTNTKPIPIHLSDPTRDQIAPHSYLIDQLTQRCDCCGATHRFTQLYAKTHLRARMERGKYITNLRPVSWPSASPTALYNLPLELRCLPQNETRVPFCHECIGRASLAHWPARPEPEAAQVVVGVVQDHQGENPTAKPKAPTRKLTIDDLI